MQSIAMLYNCIWVAIYKDYYITNIILGHSCQLHQEYDDYAVTGECQPCPVACVGGCSGPLNIATADGGCNQCNKILLYQNGSQVSCYSEVAP